MVGDKLLLTVTESTACAIACAEWSRPKSEEEKKMAGPGIGRRTVRQAVVGGGGVVVVVVVVMHNTHTQMRRTQSVGYKMRPMLFACSKGKSNLCKKP